MEPSPPLGDGSAPAPEQRPPVEEEGPERGHQSDEKHGSKREADDSGLEVSAEEQWPAAGERGEHAVASGAGATTEHSSGALGGAAASPEIVSEPERLVARAEADSTVVTVEGASTSASPHAQRSMSGDPSLRQRPENGEKKSMNKGMLLRAVAGFQSTSGRTAGQRIVATLKWALPTNTVKNSERTIDLEEVSKTGLEHSGAVHTHKTNLHQTLYTATADGNSSFANARRSMDHHSDAHSGGGGYRRGPLEGAAGSPPFAFPQSPDGRISKQFGEYFTMTPAEARRLQSITREVDSAGDSQTTLGSARLALLKLKQQVWSLLSEPDSSALATYVAFAFLGLIFISTCTFCLETIPALKGGEAAEVFSVVERVAIAVFTAEYILRLLTAPRKWEFIRGGMNIIDLVSVLPFFIELVMRSGKGDEARFLRVIRLVRVLRVLKLGSRFQKFQIVRIALSESCDMMFLLAFLFLLSLIVFSTLMFFAERGQYYPQLGIYSRGQYDLVCIPTLDASTASVSTSCAQEPSPFQSIPDTFWWCIVTLMTVGYGDIVPVTPAGKFVAALTMIQAVLLLSLPISVIGTEFTQQWLEYRSMNAAVEKGRLAPRFVALRKDIHQHNTILDELLIRVRDQIFDIEDLSMRLADKLKQKKHELSSVLLARRARGGGSQLGGGGRGGSQERDAHAERKKLQDSNEIMFLESELRQREQALKDILSQVQILLDDDIARSMDHCRRSYYALRRLWTDTQSLAGDADDIEEELEEALKQEKEGEDGDSGDEGSAGHSPIGKAGSLMKDIMSFRSGAKVPSSRERERDAGETGGEAGASDDDDDDNNEEEDKGKRGRPRMGFLGGKKKTTVVPLMVSTQPVRAVSAMKKRSSAHKRATSEDDAEGSVQAGGAAAAGAGGGEASASATAHDEQAVASRKSGRKSGKVVWTLPGDSEMAGPGSDGEPGHSPHAGGASGGGGGGVSRAGPSDTGGQGQGPEADAWQVWVPQDAAEPPGMV